MGGKPKERGADSDAALLSLQKTFDALREAVLILDGCMRILHVNRAALDLIRNTEDKVIGRHCYAVMHGAQHPFENCPTARMFVSRTREEGEVQACEKWYRVVADPVFDEKGEVACVVHVMYDITESKKTEQALRQSKEFNQAVLMSFRDHIAVLDRKGVILVVNESWLQFARENGAADKDVAGAGVNYLEVCRRSSDRGDENAAAALEGITSVMKGQRLDFQVEYPCHSPSEERWFRMTVVPFKGEKGGVIITHSCITERKIAEDALRRSEEEFRSIFELSAVGKAQVDPSTGRFTRVNRKFCEITGYAEKELLQMTFSDITHPEDRRQDQAIFESAVNEQTDMWNSEKRYLRKDGKSIWVLVNGKVIRDAQNRPFRTVATILDITARREALEALAASESILKKTQEVAHIAGWKFDILRNSLEWSAGLDTILGISPGSRLTYDDVLEMIHPDDRKMVDAQWKASLGSGGFYDIEHRFLLNGDLRWVRAKAEFECDDLGRPVFATGIIQDITDRKEKEEQSRFLEEELRHVARVSALGEMTAAIAHEVNQPLSAIMSNAQAAQRMLGNEHPDMSELREILADIISDDRRAKEVIQRLRAMLKKSEFEYGPVDMNEIIREVVPLVRSDLLIRGVWLNLELDENMSPVYGDRVQLQQVLLNLILNACDAMAGAEQRSLTIATGRGGSGEVIVRVSDSGHGIPEEHVSELFHPFFTTKEEGLGMGLAVNRAIVSAHGGRIWAENNPRRGASFLFAVPVYQEKRQ